MRPVLFIAFPSAILLPLIPAQAASDHRPAGLLSATAPFDVGVELLQRTTTETMHTIPDGANASQALIFYQARATNACNQEGP